MRRRNWILGAALVAALAVPAALHAHAGHSHKVMGTVTAVTATQVELKDTEGKTVVITLDAKTIYRSGKVKADPTGLKVGTRVVVEAEEAASAKLMKATVVQMAAPTTVVVKHASKP